MIDRYTTPEMAKIWSDENKYETWKKVEITVTEVLSDRGEVPKEAVKVINEKAAFSVERILEIEQTTRHDVIAFLTNLAENIGDVLIFGWSAIAVTFLIPCGELSLLVPH